MAPSLIDAMNEILGHMPKVHSESGVRAGNGESRQLAIDTDPMQRRARLKVSVNQ